MQPLPEPHLSAHHIFRGDSDVARRCRTLDWSSTPLGPVESWPISLRTTAAMVVAAPAPMLVLWGRERVQIFNEGYHNLMGGKHLNGLGQPTRECWPELLESSEPLYQDVLDRRETYTFHDQPLVLHRNGASETAYFTLTYSPILDDTGEAGGILITIAETTPAIERAEAEQAREQSEERLRMAVDAAGLATWDVDLVNGGRLSRSLYHDQLYGYSEFQPDWNREVALRHILPEDRPLAKQAFLQAEATGTVAFETRIRWPDQSIHWISVRGRTFYDREGRPVRIAGVVTDTTEQNRMAALRESEERFRLMADTIPQLVWVTDADGDVEFLNRQWTAYSGQQQRPENSTDVVATAIHPDDADVTKQAFDEARREECMFVVEHRLRSTEGEYRWFLAKAEPYRDPVSGEVSRWFGASVDIHDRKVAEARLRESESRYRTLFETMDQGFGVAQIYYHPDGSAADFRWLETNPAFQRHTGFFASADKTVRELVPDLEQCWFDIYGRVAKSGEALRFVQPSPALERWFDVYAFPLGDPGDHQVAVLFSDITDRQKAEAALQRANARLIESDRRKDEFLAMLAHELRNPLAAIGNTVKLLERGALEAPNGAESRQRYLDILNRQTDMLRGLVNDLLDVSRITRGLVRLKQQRVNLIEVIERAVASVQPTMDEKHHHVSVTLPSKPVEIMGDAVRLEQIVANLLTNAAKYTDPGGRIGICLERQGETAKLKVIDTGIGLTKEILERIFDLFGQAERSLARSEGGLGIGLTIVKNLVELHEGQVTAHSEGPGQGAEFSVALPLASTEEPASAPSQQTARPPVRSKRVLVVEDSPDIAETMVLLLEAAGHQIAQATDGPSALIKAEEFGAEVVLLDIGLPGMDGYEVARRLRNNLQTRDAVLVALTGYGQAEDIERSHQAGFEKHFTKPVDIASLEDFINRAEDNAE